MIVCTACGKENADNFNFCLDCGNDLRRIPTAPAAPPPPLAAVRPVLAAPAPIPLQAVAQVPAAPPPPPPAAMNAVAAIPLTQPAAPEPIPLTQPKESGERRCPSCSAAVPPGFSFCGACGTRLAQDDAAPKGGTMFMHAVDSAAKPKARLVTIRPDGGEGMTFTLKAEETLSGRSSGIVLFPEDPFVSPKHCRFFYKEDRLWVEDLGSLNGVYKKIRGEAEIPPGHHLRLGRQLLRLEPMSGPGREPADGTRVWGSPDPGYRARLLQLLEGGGVGEVFPLKGGDNLVGREQGDITFPTDGFVSGRHATLFVEGEKVKVRDLGSSNGTFLRLDAATALDHGDFLLVGNQLLRIDVR